MKNNNPVKEFSCVNQTRNTNMQSTRGQSYGNKTPEQQRMHLLLLRQEWTQATNALKLAFLPMCAVTLETFALATLREAKASLELIKFEIDRVLDTPGLLGMRDLLSQLGQATELVERAKLGCQLATGMWIKTQEPVNLNSKGHSSRAPTILGLVRNYLPPHLQLCLVKPVDTAANRLCSRTLVFVDDKIDVKVHRIEGLKVQISVSDLAIPMNITFKGLIGTKVDWFKTPEGHTIFYDGISDREIARLPRTRLYTLTGRVDTIVCKYVSYQISPQPLRIDLSPEIIIVSDKLERGIWDGCSYLGYMATSAPKSKLTWGINFKPQPVLFLRNSFPNPGAAATKATFNISISSGVVLIEPGPTYDLALTSRPC
jgi:hypothetical protein